MEKQETKKYSEEELDAAIIRYLRSDEDFFKERVKIRDHFSQQILPLTLNRSQRIIHAVFERQKAVRGMVRVFILKSRRVGASTYVEARFYKRTSLQKNRNTFIVAHEEESTRTIYNMAKLMHEKNDLAPATRYSSAQELVFDTEKSNGLHSQYRMATAKTVDAGRSQGIHYLHGSEVAVWPDAEELLSGLMQGMPPLPAETECVFESTAKGFGNFFQKGCFKSYNEGKLVFHEENGIPYAWWNPDDSDFIVIFIPWFVHEIYTKEFYSREEQDKFERRVNEKVLDKESLEWVVGKAKKLQDKYGLTLEQLNWREWCINNQCQGREEIFEQEYPSTFEEAFLSKGSNVYSKQLCDQIESGCIDPILVGDVVERAGVPKIKPTPYGKLAMYRRPKPTMQCFITVDCAGGLKKSQEERNREPDPSCVDVWDLETGEQVAQWHGHIDYDYIAELVDRIGRLYAYTDVRGINGERGGKVLPLACVELNNHGFAVVADLKRLRYPQYEYADGEPGWQTTIRTRPRMIDDAARCCRDGSLQIRSKETVSEMRTFVEKAGGRQEAEEGCHDERVMTLGMASQMVACITRYREPLRGERREEVKVAGVDTWRKEVDDGSYKEVYVR